MNSEYKWRQFLQTLNPKSKEMYEKRIAEYIKYCEKKLLNKFEELSYHYYMEYLHSNDNYENNENETEEENEFFLNQQQFGV